jgi:hypothetical protein
MLLNILAMLLNFWSKKNEKIARSEGTGSTPREQDVPRCSSMKVQWKAACVGFRTHSCLLRSETGNLSKVNCKDMLLLTFVESCSLDGVPEYARLRTEVRSKAVIPSF